MPSCRYAPARGVGLMLALACLLSPTRADPDVDPYDLEPSGPRVIGVAVTEASLAAHHTDHFQDLRPGFAVRRGQPFDLDVTLSEPIPADWDIFASVAELPGPVISVHAAARNGSSQTVRVSARVPVDARVGRFTLQLSTVQNAGEEGFIYRFPFAFYVLFNPWLPADTAVFMADAADAAQYVLQDRGFVFDGSVHKYRRIDWEYGVGKAVALEAAVYLLQDLEEARPSARMLASAKNKRKNENDDDDDYDYSDDDDDDDDGPKDPRADPLAVAAHISRAQGFYLGRDNRTIVGNPRGILEGRWLGSFDDGVNPDAWNSTVDILDRWKRSGGNATRYGQCFIYAALQTTLLRALGIPARQLSAFVSRVDASAKRDRNHRMHHVVDAFYDARGTLLASQGRVWNYHSWNEMHVRPFRNSSAASRNGGRGGGEPSPLARFNGWHSVDGTPPGFGVASTRAILERNESAELGRDTGVFISSTHATLRDFLVDGCKAGEPVPDACATVTQLNYDARGVPLVLTSRALANGSLAEHDITASFVDPKADAFIPFDNATVSPPPPPVLLQLLQQPRGPAERAGDENSVLVVRAEAASGAAVHDVQATAAMRSATGEQLGAPVPLVAARHADGTFRLPLPALRVAAAHAGATWRVSAVVRHSSRSGHEAAQVTALRVESAATQLSLLHIDL